ncbi:MAG TPA: hypothetical protein VIJ01_02665 [Candidatus Angelobacter sp.]
MKACRLAIIVVTILSAVNALALQAASNNTCGDCDAQPPRFELGVAASGIHLSDNNNFGVGARAVFNLNSFFSLEGEGNFFLNNASPKLFSGGRAVEGLFGPKIGLRTENVGIFAKVRPGVISFSNTIQGITINPTVPFSFSVQTGRLTAPALDLGTVVEFYPARHWAWRTDIGDTMVFYRSSSFSSIRVPGTTRSNFQFNTGLQYRF